MRLIYLGHAAFFLESSKGTRLLMDPYQAGYKGMINHRPIEFTGEIVTISHDHGDHNASELVSGDATVLKGVGSWSIRDVNVQSIPTFHDNEGGKLRGGNNVFTVAVDNIRICHLGDLGHLLSEQQVSTIGKVHILLVPVGGTYTIDSEQALLVANQINAPVLVPMHYKTEKVGFPLLPLDAFLRCTGNAAKIERRKQLEVEAVASIPTNRHIIILEPLL
jgi:L-ascorbate metabolism protein UlaG (beta-lactamase superfamily)